MIRDDRIATVTLLGMLFALLLNVNLMLGAGVGFCIGMGLAIQGRKQTPRNQ